MKEAKICSKRGNILKSCLILFKSGDGDDANFYES